MTTLYAQYYLVGDPREGSSELQEKIVMSVPDDADLSRIDLPVGMYIAERGGNLFSITVTKWQDRTITRRVRPIITERIVKFVRHHSRAIPKGTIGIVQGPLCKGRNGFSFISNMMVLTSNNHLVYVRSELLRNHSIDRLSPKMKEWATMYLLGNG